MIILSLGAGLARSRSFPTVTSLKSLGDLDARGLERDPVRMINTINLVIVKDDPRGFGRSGGIGHPFGTLVLGTASSSRGVK